MPARFAASFKTRAAQAALNSHRGLDFGALALARELAQRCQVPLLAGQQTRLLIDLNRSPGHQSLFSEWSRHLPPRDREHLRAVHEAHLNELSARVQASRGLAVHVAVHSFTPVLAGKRRNFDVGLLYDPGRPREVSLANRLREALLAGNLTVRRNAPYRGIADGAPTWLRRRFSDVRYAGIELEVNQAFLWHEPNGAKRRAVLDGLLVALE